MFRSHKNTAPVEQAPRRSGTLFGRNRAASPVRTNDTTKSSGIFGHRRSSSSSDNDRQSRSRFGRNNDPVSMARSKVSEAEAAERAADQALISARQSVVRAKQHAKGVVGDAEKEARVAKMRHSEAKSVSKDAKHLGKFN